MYQIGLVVLVLLTGCAQVVPHRECEGRWIVRAADGRVQSVVYFDDVCGSGK